MDKKIYVKSAAERQKVKFISRAEVISIVDSLYQVIGWPHFRHKDIPSYKIIDNLPWLTLASEIKRTQIIPGKEYHECLQRWKQAIKNTQNGKHAKSMKSPGQYRPGFSIQLLSQKFKIKP